MSIEDGRLKSDGKTIEPCCEGMVLLMSKPVDLREGKVIFKFTTLGYSKDFHERDLVACPICGAKLEYVKDLKVKQ
ncbi:MAG: hypothetical protein WCS21_07730 [Lachnospiraceae bacterium]